MEITGKGPGLSIEAYVTRIKEKEAVSPVEDVVGRPSPKEDKVILSPEAREVQEAKKALDNMPDIRAEKVNQIRSQMANGTYEVKGGQVAVKMIHESLINQLL